MSSQLGDIEQRIRRQLTAIENGVDPLLVGERIEALKGEREQTQAALTDLEIAARENGAVDLEDARLVLDGIPDLGKSLTAAEPKLRRAVFDAFRLSVEIDRNAGHLRVKALVSSAFTGVRDLKSLVTNGGVAGAGIRTCDLRVMSPSLGVPLDYVGHGFKRFSRDRDRLGSAGICGACCPICCPSRPTGRTH